MYLLKYNVISSKTITSVLIIYFKKCYSLRGEKFIIRCALHIKLIMIKIAVIIVYIINVLLN